MISATSSQSQIIWKIQSHLIWNLTVVTQLFRFCREMELEQSHQVDVVRETALAQRKTVYLPAKHPEEP
jgi:hypothetical protein